jgi:hypothetical protein
MKLNSLFETDSRAKTQQSFRIPGTGTRRDDPGLTVGMVGSPAYMAPEKIKATGYRGKDKSFEDPEYMGEPAVATERTPTPPFPYHPKGNSVKDPQNQIYWTLRSETSMSWDDIKSKIAPYLKKLKSVGHDLPSSEDYVAAMTELLKRKVIHKAENGKYTAF